MAGPEKAMANVRTTERKKDGFIPPKKALEKAPDNPTKDGGLCDDSSSQIDPPRAESEKVEASSENRITHLHARHTARQHRRQTRRLPPVPRHRPPTKSKVEFGCMGKDGFFDDLKIWKAEPLK